MGKHKWNKVERDERLRKGIKGTTIHKDTSIVGRNEPCPCGSDKKYKHCCGVKEAPIIRPDDKGRYPKDFANPKCSVCHGTGVVGFRNKGEDGDNNPILCSARGCSLEKYSELLFNEMLEERKKQDEEKKAKEVEEGEADVTETDDGNSNDSEPTDDGGGTSASSED